MNKLFSLGNYNHVIKSLLESWGADRCKLPEELIYLFLQIKKYENVNPLFKTYTEYVNLRVSYILIAWFLETVTIKYYFLCRFTKYKKFCYVISW